MAKAMLRVWVAGPRAWSNEEPIRKLVLKLEGLYGIGRLLLLTGGATGVDDLVEKIGNERGIHVVRVRAAWPIGRKAGPIRNGIIAEELEPVQLIALHYWPLTQSNHRGTQSAISKARLHGIPVKTLRVSVETALPESVADNSPMGNRARALRGLPAKPKKVRRKP